MWFYYVSIGRLPAVGTCSDDGMDCDECYGCTMALCCDVDVSEVVCKLAALWVYGLKIRSSRYLLVRFVCIFVATMAYSDPLGRWRGFKPRKLLEGGRGLWRCLN